MTKERLTAPENWARFLLAGGVLDWETWAELKPETRDDLVLGAEIAQRARDESLVDAIVERLEGSTEALESREAVEAGLRAATGGQPVSSSQQRARVASP